MKQKLFVLISMLIIYASCSYASTNTIQLKQIPNVNVNGLRLNEEVYEKSGLIVYGSPQGMKHSQRWKQKEDGNYILHNNNDNIISGEYWILGENYSGGAVYNPNFPMVIQSSSEKQWKYINVQNSETSWISQIENHSQNQRKYMLTQKFFQNNVEQNISDNEIEIDCTNISKTEVPYEFTQKARASYYFIGALLSRFKEANVGTSGGCNIGSRPIDQHIKAFELLGANIDIEGGMINAKATELKGNDIYFDVVSVGATINAILAATLAEGTTVIENAAKEPHIVDVANFLNNMGANIRGAGTDIIKITGVKELTGGATYSIVPDQIEAGTFMMAAAASKGDVTVTNCIPKHLDSITAKLIEMGLEVTENDEGDAIRVRYVKRPTKVNIKTMPYPGFPTDMQAQAGAVLAIAEGTSIINEGIWESRFRYTEELNKMGAKITANGKTAVFEGVEELHGCPVSSTDLRAGAALIIAGIAATGETIVSGIEYVDRGYENIEKKFNSLGANITRISE